jgi:phosphoglycolate phosphatase-like HAD superfamily hydrolase
MEALQISPAEMVYVGDEQKDITTANQLGIRSVLVCRAEEIPDYGQTHTIKSLREVLGLI